ncbi:hypothetical protein [Burkholderia arboris]|nr:hypothetical protein [Burkholderia arboris]
MTPTFDTLDAAGARARSQARKAAIGSFVGAVVGVVSENGK